MTKVNAPTEVRGDLIPATDGDVELRRHEPRQHAPRERRPSSDDQCGPVDIRARRPGSTPATPTATVCSTRREAWQFTCAARCPGLTTEHPGRQNVVNTATAFGTPTDGHDRQRATATDDVHVFTPGISLTKLVNGQPAVTVATGTQVTYTYAVANTGNTPLSTVTLVDDTPPCAGADTRADTPGNDDARPRRGRDLDLLLPGDRRRPR